MTWIICIPSSVNSGHVEADFEFTIALDGTVNETVNMAPPDKSADIPTPEIVKYNWSEKDVGSLQSAYFIGYLGTEYAFKTFHDLFRFHDLRSNLASH